MQILIADDDPISRMALADVVARITDLPLVEAGDGEAAWSILDQNGIFDLVITDIRMPRLDGLGLIAKIRTDQRFVGLPLMLVTSAADRETVQHALEYGIQGFLIKPTTLACLERVLNVLDRFHAQLIDSETTLSRRLGCSPAKYWRYAVALNAQTQTLIQQLTQAQSLEALEQFPDWHNISELTMTHYSAARMMGAQWLMSRLDVLSTAIPQGPTSLKDLAAHIHALRLHEHWLERYIRLKKR